MGLSLYNSWVPLGCIGNFIEIETRGNTILPIAHPAHELSILAYQRCENTYDGRVENIPVLRVLCKVPRIPIVLLCLSTPKSISSIGIIVQVLNPTLFDKITYCYRSIQQLNRIIHRLYIHSYWADLPQKINK